ITPQPDISSSTTPEFDYKESLKTSQQAIGNKLSNHRFMSSTEGVLFLQELQGKPLVISMVYTSCFHTCPMTTRHLAKVVKKARDALGNQSFNVALIGFDVKNDTPSAMRYFGRQNDINDDGWKLLSTDQATRDLLIKELGFIYFPSIRGFDHLVQATVVDADGIVYRQVYGEVFDTPLLVEPLKDLVFGRTSSTHTLIDDLVNRVKLFCTTYDPVRDAYIFDYSLFVGIFVGLSVLIPMLIFIVRGWKRTAR
ncbi:MAG: SCO family protein, partial [Candidatus Polarisedimenticolaceae bacterium]|nr:SCO family protein [Candidatus Polarisedimenticolaceae bacterium]